ncbi:MAG: methyltransferase domain-containing protein [Burkholderiaceae bacterium]
MTDPQSAEAIRQLSRERYRTRAAAYDETCSRTWPLRERAVERLRLIPGQRVLDVGCGTGLSFALLRERVGDRGVVYGCEQSPEMAELARRRIVRHGWTNVHLVEQPAHELVLPELLDALLFNYTHDICRSEDAVVRLMSLARPSAIVSMAGIKAFPLWLMPLNLYVWFKNRAYNGRPGELRSPWDIVGRWVPDLVIEPTQLGMGYLAHGRVARPPTEG